MPLDSISANTLLDLAQAQSSAAKLEANKNKIATAPDHVREIAEEFEAVFLNTMLETMFAGVKTDGMFGGGQSEGMYRSMMNQEYANAIAKSGGIGIADDLYEEILRTQESSQKETK
jgi:flagellar protein FlgJ